MNELQDRNPNPLTIKDYLLISSLLFALFFGAGNLIFPLHLGQLSGSNWFIAALGFLVTAVVLPLLSVLAISITKSKGVFDIGLPLGKPFALTFMVLIHATIGPFFGTPRTATVAFSVGIEPLLPKNYTHVGLLIFSGIFFLCAFLLSYKETNIMKSVGKLLNPLFLILLFLVFLFAFMSPLGHANQQNVTDLYQHSSFFHGFLEGYNTMDALAGLSFGVTVVTAVNQLGKTNPKSNAKVTAKSGFLATGLIGIIYLILIWLGATSLNQFKLSNDGGIAFNQIMKVFMGNIGPALLATLLTLTCLTTAVGLVAAFAQDFYHHFKFFSYRTWLTLMCLTSFLAANFGLEKIIAWSLPVLMFLYPFAIVLILLSVCSPLFKKDSSVYLSVVLFTLFPALLDMLKACPSVITQNNFVHTILNLQTTYLPFADIGMDWVIPALIGLVIGLLVYKFKNKKSTY